MRPLNKPAVAALLVLALCLALAGCGGGNSDGDTSSSSVLAKGLKWTVTVRQDSSGIVADASDASTYDTKFDYRVTKAASGSKGTWTVFAKERGAQGPFAKGYEFAYAQGPGKSVTLTSVSLAGGQAVPADQARGVVGMQFPLDLKLTKRPTSRTVKPSAAAGGGGAPGLPPSLPSGGVGGSTGGAAPPASGGDPTAPPAGATD